MIRREHATIELIAHRLLDDIAVEGKPTHTGKHQPEEPAARPGYRFFP
jgi:hypothetical protein